MAKYKNKYRIESTRLKGYDYGKNGAYFITICTSDREHYFGEIANGKMNLNDLGSLAEKYWEAIPNQFSFVKLGEFVIMPDHVHGILIIDKLDDDDNYCGDNYCGDAINRVSTIKTGGFAGDKNPMFHENISRIIRWYKGRCTFEMRKIHADFAWQSLFHDHIIRNDESYWRISNYIKNNPLKWLEDRFNDP